jgi:hypothetical protein
MCVNGVSAICADHTASVGVDLTGVALAHVDLHALIWVSIN